MKTASLTSHVEDSDPNSDPNSDPTITWQSRFAVTCLSSPSELKYSTETHDVTRSQVDARPICQLA